jgi:hypothetical protein
MTTKTDAEMAANEISDAISKNALQDLEKVRQAYIEMLETKPRSERIKELQYVMHCLEIKYVHGRN